MKEAIFEAQCAYQKGEVPVGAVIVFDGKIIARGHNQTESLQDPTAHAEVMAIREAGKVVSNWRLIDCTLYTTLEPCAMCAGAMFLARIARLVWGARDMRHGANGSFINIFDQNHPTHTIEVEGGVCADESAALLKTFFKEQRDVKKNDSNARRASIEASQGAGASCHCR